ncbi:unnamed protein product [Arctia plantaginis]|uniref:Uncharacterized protein n=1 Tax=Arctia plantaginis TaxID=874455 RepID=A0A8S1ARN5_ARCPL|nr:unnamed protein product [Arctia plantaginis]CAB3248443.1 unnamed protein product [Arctia plantaginis]
METRKDNLTALKLCRFCLSQDETLTSLYDRNRAPKNSVPLPLKILSCVSIEVFPSDRMPSYICNRCKFFMDISYEYKQMCRQADENVLQYIQSGTDLNSVSWPSSLQKLFRVATKSAPELAVMKTVVEGGATVQVTANGSDSEEEDDENVYNVKIGDGSDEGPKNARVKVITGNKQNKGKPKPGKGFLSVSKLTSHVRGHAGDRSYPCKYCNKSFMKSHHYTRHLRIKHREAISTCRGPFGESPDQYRCEQCDDTFSTQDELIYHSAIHATQNLICPLCQEKFEDVDAVTVHIKSHVNGTEFMCDLCELVFTSKEKLDNHITIAHEDELRSEGTGQDESSVEMDVEDDEDEATINLKEEDDHMVVEIKKPDDFMLTTSQSEELGAEHSNSEESDSEITFTNLATVDTLAMTRKEAANAVSEKPVFTSTADSGIIKTIVTAPKNTEKTSLQTAPILRRAEEIKRKVQSSIDAAPEKRNTKTESNNTGASDKSLRLLEKELQELKRTNTRTETVKTSAKSIETLRNRRPQIHTSTPKLKTSAVEEKKTQIATKTPALEKKQPERRIVTKENKEPKEVKDTKGNNVSAKDEKDNKEKEKDTPKNIAKNGPNEKSTGEEGIRRSTRPSKIKDYAKMIRDRSQDSEDDDDSDEVDEEYKETEKIIEKPKARRGSIKSSAKPVLAAAASPAATPVARKRGRPRKINTPATPAKVRKEDNNSEEVKSDDADKESENEIKPKGNAPPSGKANEKVEIEKDNKLVDEVKSAPGVLVSPTGQTLKKIPIKALPPGIKPLPLPVNARPLSGGEVCEMQIGKKVVKVQKIVMTKAEVEAMAKKGLVEMKDGTMVLKQGIKLPTSDPSAIKNLVGDESATKESPIKSDKATPTRCNMDEET